MLGLRHALVASFFLWGTGVAAQEAASRLELVMVEQRGCAYCARWDAEIAPIYPKTEEANRAPLRRIDLRAPVPEDLSLARPAIFTPTFVLVRDGAEVDRIEGYPGPDFFWSLLGDMLTKADGEAENSTHDDLLQID